MSATVLETPLPPFSDAPAAGLSLGPEQGSDAHAWRAEASAAGWQKFEALPFPVRGEEAWRFSSLKALDLGAYRAPVALTASERAALRERSLGLAETAGRMVFGNDELLERQVLSDEVSRKGILWLPLAEAAQHHPEVFRQRFMQEEAILGSRKFAALHEAWVRNGTYLYVPRGVELELPLETFHWLQGENASCFPHTLIVAEENSRVTLVDYFRSADAGTPGFACGVNDLWLGTGAKVTYVNVQQWSREVRGVQINSTIVGRDAAAVALSAQFGGAYIRSESISHLRGEGGRSDMLSFAVADGRREIDQRTLQIHEVPHTASDLLYKNALDDQSRSVFSGLIRVAPGAHFTDAYQKVRNLLLSDDAEANSAPGLEIEADNVRCTHGATSGQVEAEELFYLLSRGIPRAAAQKLIVLGFLDDVIQRLPQEPLREKLRELLRARYGI